MRKVLIFSTNYAPNIGGAEIAVSEITSRLSAQGFSFFLITSRLKRSLPKTENVGKVAVFRVGFGTRFDKWLLPFFGLIKALRLHQKNRFDLVWTIMASQAAVAASFFVFFHKKIPMMLTLQEGDEEEHLKRYVFGNTFLYERLILPFHHMPILKATRITVISEYLKKRAENVKKELKITLVPNGVSFNFWNKKIKTENLERLAESLKIKPTDKVLITVSRLVRKNAVGDLIQSLQYLPTDIVLLIVGEGEEKEPLLSLAEVYGVRNRVIFAGKVPNDQLPSYLRISDIFIRPSISEGFGISFIEGFAAGLPVIATPVGGITDFLIDGETGLFCKVRSPKDIADKVKILLADKKLVSKIVANAKKLAKEKYDWDVIANKMKEVFNSQ
ncbi:MAG: glycosyltransferase family 4 protein [bacterium]|nr:glycosyltransferase family 4 protein [bacterium]